MNDSKLGVVTGVDGIDVVFGINSMLQKFSHGKILSILSDPQRRLLNISRVQSVKLDSVARIHFRVI